jgi:NTP pyrophosphatase (non-canonical NTP hydrolase)
MPTSEQLKRFEEHVHFRMHKDGRPMPFPFIVLGLVGEGGEVAAELEKPLEAWDREAIKSELGDVLWYFQAICSSMDIPSYGLIPVDDGSSFLVVLSRLAEAGKKMAWHGKEYRPDQIADMLRPVLGHLLLISTATGVSLAEAMEANIEKLEKRYPRGFVEGGGIRESGPRPGFDANGMYIEVGNG